MGSCSTPLHIIDDGDEEFDWEAAVKEIDVACSRRATTTEKPNLIFPKFSCDSGISLDPLQEVLKKGKFNVNFGVSSTRQATLDRFVGIPSSCAKKPFENGEFIYSNVYKNGGVAECEGAELLNGYVKIDPEAAKTWIYPVNVPHRDYQFSITRTALFSNTLVVLPTGLGKTLIAAAVMYNYFRWFPEGKIVFAAPSRPLVMQQIEACHKIVGIPQEWTIDLTGQTNPTKRAVYWKDKRVFFVTPQVLEKDIDAGSCLVKHLVCLVIDEAHRATGNYSYCVAVHKLIGADVQLRILALSATPGSKKQTIQHVINNLKISTLEYRNESDPDVLPYVHERKLELIEVPMGNEADQINDLILEAVRPLVTRLCSYRVLQNRDLHTFSPYDLLKSRDKFRQEPPLELSHAKSGDIEGCFGVLITLYHVRKLLSSHGIRPAFEMLEEKLKEGNFARLMSRNENILNAKLVMQQTLSHGATSPKLVKLLEVLIDHFRVKDPQNSRVIIFSHFRGSVRDIMDALANIGEFVKATEFIGQSSGKNLKGQSQKVQQAVLQKFRTGGYNVIVATSIGEEGLDIMEVDLVVCFDANISPLRMIQRMGRTGRKNEGRVVVLACEGAELKGYMKKKANSKAIKKHMHNGGMNSFSFHPSPRMIPHIFRPEVHYLEMSIDEFIPRGKKLKDDNLMPVPLCKTKLTDAETDVLAKYFASSGDVSWRPSLIAFPHFQTFPCPVKEVAHSSTTGILIDTMQYLQGLRFSQDSETLLTKDGDISDPCLRVDMIKTSGKIIRERFDDTAGEHLETEAVQCDVEIGEIARAEDVHIKDLHKQKPRTHTFLFGSEFVSVDDLGNILVLSLPQLLLKSCSQSGFTEGKNVLETILRNDDAQNGKLLSMPEKILQTPDSNRMPKQMEISGECHNIANDTTGMQLVNESSDDEFRDAELSPRLTSFIENGLVPESPINKTATWNGVDNSTVPTLVSSQDMKRDSPKTSGQQNDRVAADGYLRKMDVLCSNSDGIHKHALRLNNNAPRDCVSPISVGKETQTPCAKLSNTSSSRDWLLESGVKPETVEQQCKFRRLRKHADLNREVDPESMEQTGRSRKLRRNRQVTDHDSAIKLVKGQKKKAKDVAVYIEEEAEIASDNMASDDDEDGLDNSSYEDSFIDDGTHPTSAITQAGCSKPDMMAVYRRSLLSQSPFQRLPNFSTSFSPDSVVQSSRVDERSSKDNESPQAGLESTGRNSQFKISEKLLENENQLDNRKRKLSFYQAHSVLMVNLDEKFSLLSEAAGKNSSMQIQADNKVGKDILEDDDDDDDQFYERIDLDAVEEEAAKLFRSKPECSMQKTPATNEHSLLNFGMLGSPSFDLGI